MSWIVKTVSISLYSGTFLDFGRPGEEKTGGVYECYQYI